MHSFGCGKTTQMILVVIQLCNYGNKRDASPIFPANSKPIDSPIKTAGHTLALTPLPKISSAVWVF